MDFGTVNYSQGRLNWRGAWSSGANYAPNDAISLAGSSYIAIANSINISPGNTLYWSIMCSAGGVSSVAGKTGVVTLVAADITDKDAALGVAGLDASGFIKSAELTTNVNAQVGTSYTIVAGDRGKLLTLSNTNPVALTVPAASGSFAAGFFLEVTNLNTGLVMLTPTTSTIDGAASITLKQFQSITLTSVGGNWVCLRSRPVASFADITGTAAMAQGGTGVDLSAGGGTTMVLAQNASHVISARNLVAADIPVLPASQITTGQLALAHGGTAVDLSATGGTTAVLAQDASHVISARNLVAADIPSLATVTETLKNKNLVSAANGNTVSLLDSQGVLTAVTGNGTDLPLYTKSVQVPGTSKGIKITFCVLINAAATTFKLTFGGSLTYNFTTNAANEHVTGLVVIMNNSGVTNAQSYVAYPAIGGVAVFGTTSGTLAIDTSVPVTVTLTGNCAAANTMTPKQWLVEAIQ
jgi:hypothetical protein